MTTLFTIGIVIALVTSLLVATAKPTMVGRGF